MRHQFKSGFICATAAMLLALPVEAEARGKSFGRTIRVSMNDEAPTKPLAAPATATVPASTVEAPAVAAPSQAQKAEPMAASAPAQIGVVCLAGCFTPPAQSNGRAR